MVRWAIAFFVLALLAAFLGFGGMAGDLAWIGKLFLVVFAVLFVLALVTGRRMINAPPV
jgi:uncharacterized membrane protein YtjA (UPF0391 family)